MSALTRNFTHTCTIRRPISTRNEIGESIETFSDHIVGQSCRFIEESQEVPASVDELSSQVVYDALLMLPPTVDVERLDQITAVTFEDASVEPGPFKIAELLKKRSRKKARFILLALERVE